MLRRCGCSVQQQSAATADAAAAHDDADDAER